MLTGEMARYQIQDRVRDAEAYRLSAATRIGRTARQRNRAGQVARAVGAVLLWPVRHG
jgi:hypothetical protein